MHVLVEVHKLTQVVCCVCSELLVGMGYAKKDIEDSLRLNKYDEIMATYLLLGRKSFDVRMPHTLAES